jgi:hypothetical protein
MTPARSVIAAYCSGRRCAAKLNIFVLALATEIKIDVGNDDLIRKRHCVGNNAAIGIDDARAADQARTVLVACFGYRDRPGRVHVGVAPGFHSAIWIYRISLDSPQITLYVPVLFQSGIEGRLANVRDVGLECDGRGST